MRKLSRIFVVMVAVLAIAGPAAWAGAAKMSIDPGRVQWDAQGDYERAILTVSMPGGEVVRQEFDAKQTPIFDLAAGAKDGVYNFELRLEARIDASLRKALAEARKSGNEAEMSRLRAQLPESPVVSGSFMVEAGAILMPEGKEPQTPKGRKVTSAAGTPGVITAADQVIPDDLIVQGSECVGLDCVNNENFGFDTIRLKENNLRIHFDDTSTQAGFPANDWRLIANDSASGGSSKFSIEDSTSSKTPFTITAGAATNSIFTDSTGRVGFRTSTPVLDLHVNTSNTPAIRLEQNNSGGFTAQTWDIGANEANFFIRDVTGGSKLSLRIRPGAPTSSVDISADGDVGIGDASPDDKLDVEADSTNAGIIVHNTNANGFSGLDAHRGSDDLSVFFLGYGNAQAHNRINSTQSIPLLIMTNSTERIRFPAPGTDFIQATNGAELTAGGVWQDNSSRASKHDIIELSDAAALETLRELTPVTFRYNAEPEEQYVGFIAEDLPDLVATNDHKHMNATDVVAVLTKVVQDQQKTIEELSARLAGLEAEKE